MIVQHTADFFRLAGVPSNDQPSSGLDKTSSEQLFNEFSGDIFITIRSAQNVLEQSRENYFSNMAHSATAFSNQQRQDFDNEIKQMLQNIVKRINELDEMVKGREFCRTETHKAHYTGAIGCLYQASKKPSNSLREFVSHSQKLKLKLLKYCHYRFRLMNMQSERPASLPAPADSPPDLLARRQSNPELQQQSKMILLRNSDKRDQILSTQQIITEINRMLDETSNKVLQQQFQTSTIMEIGEAGLSNIKKGNNNLVQANASSKQIGRYWIWFFNTLTVLILLLDFIKS